MVSLFFSETVLCTPGSGVPQTLFGVLLFGFALVWALANLGSPWLGQPSLSLVVSVATSLLGFAAFLFGLLLIGLFDDLLGYGGFGCGIQWVYLPAAAMSLAGALLLLWTGRRVWQTK
ncbi:hypothetical protein [Haloprofundus halobius]|uniref:hypothetical protein n=1 Tax=Haloprofundus halobius TaxID=2876194 RepID=UPI001CCA1BF2|nr:hypothetical protein [Haloprofundus halobius]